MFAGLTRWLRLRVKATFRFGCRTDLLVSTILSACVFVCSFGLGWCLCVVLCLWFNDLFGF